MKHTFYLGYPNAEQSPVMLAIRDKGKRVTISIGLTIKTADWDKDEQRVKKGANDYRYANDKLLESERAVERAKSYGKLDNLSLPEVANLYRKEMGMEQKEVKTNDKLFMPFYRTWAHTSFGKHKVSRANALRFKIFEKFIGKAEPTFDEIDYNLYVRFLTELQKKYKPNMQGSVIKDLKAAMNEAYKRGLHTNIAFKRFEKPSEQVTTVYLTNEEVDKIYNAELSGGMEQARDIFILGCYTGLRFSDYSRLTAENADQEFITKIQQKTLSEVCIPVHPRVKKILKKWGGAPKITQQKTNMYIKSICAALEINEDIEITDNGKIEHKKKWEMVSTHTARRTAATNLLLSGASIHEVMHFLGHSSVTQTQTYLRITSKENAKILAKNKFFTEQ